MRLVPRWVRLAEIDAAKPKPIGYVYIMSRADGWHKIGNTGSGQGHRRVQVACHVEKRLRPVKTVTMRPLFSGGATAEMAERFAHDELVRLGYERGVGRHRSEWFCVSECVARRVVRMAINWAKSANAEHVRRQRLIASQRKYLAKKRVTCPKA